MDASSPDQRSGDAERHFAELNTVQRIAQVITSALRLDQICQAVVDQVHQAFGYKLVSIYLCEGERLLLQAQVGYSKVMAVIRSDQGASGRVVRSGQAAMVLDGASDPDFIAVMPGICQGIIVPLRYGDGPVLGTISVESDGDPPLRAADLALLDLLANQISVAVVNAQLLARSEASADRFSALLEVADCVVYCVDPALRITEWNGEAERAFGLHRQELIGQPVFERVISEGDRAPMRAIAQQLLDGQILKPFEWPIRNPDGSVRYFLWTTATRRDANGALVEILVVGHDITRRREAEEARLALERKMLEAQRLESLGVLAGGIAHDFNNMLAAIIGNASLLLLDLTPGTEPYQSAREIDLVGHRAAELVAQMLAYAGQGSFTVQTFSLNELVAEMLVLLRTSISKGTTLMQRLGPGLPSISGDLAQVRQVVMNLIVNASEALDQRDGLVTISTALYQIDAATAATFTLTPGIAPGRYIGLTIEDTGIGMDPGIVGRIFEPFFTTKFTGRGLGLAAVLGIMRAHGGGLSVASALGLGSRFTALFPVAAGEFPVAFHHEPAVFLTRAEGEPSYTPVLLIDDEADVRRATARLLERAGYTPLLAADGQHGLVIAADPQQPIAVALIDLTMPGLNGEQLFRELRRLRPTLPVAVISGYASDAITHRFVAEQPDAFLQKPFSAASLLELVGRLAQRSQS